ncbi:hypothetical protein HYALB_00001182 [Hymenoscyphus albidus]|uniref:NADH-ubiquinone oxidoreductase 21.3 kDa subunit n=1 Tax=Hymenoscyphus albidus TaxID=595503 RepID=A0A9N9LH39_9HELO|nr:hypothetical protein HYALB_00001182 [Hymenoscyphus albidus]
MSSQAAVKVAQATNRVIDVKKKYTVQSTGIWELVRRFFAVDPTRSNGVPLNPQFRNPPPGSNDPLSFKDPVTLPAGDIADNPYWKRDARRNYPQLSFVNQADAVALLSIGSASAPKKELIGEAGSKELMTVKEEGETGLSAYFSKEGKSGVLAALGKDGMPPLPSGASLKVGADKYKLTEENAYPQRYPCRTFQ